MADANNSLDTVTMTLSTTDGAGLQPGSVVGGRYRIVSLLGSGGMGEVYRADDLKVGQHVALKFLPLHFAAAGSRVARFVDEVRLARKISHPNVCRVYDIGEADGRHYLSMEYIDGENLASVLQRIGRLPHEKVVEIARQLCAGLAAAHDQGVLHRDLKPANIMIDGRGHARITDFGLAVTTERSTAGDVAGTPAYMAPEQLFGGTLTAQTDLFALGLILHELLTGKRVFSETTLQQRRLSARDAAGRARSAVERDIDSPLQNVIARCLHDDAAARPASAQSVAAALPGGADPLMAALAAGQIPSPAVERSAVYEPFIRVARPSEQGGLFFIYRQSPHYLISENTFGVVSYREPPADVSGMADVTLDPAGRLVRFTAVPGLSRGSPAAREQDWSVPFSEAGLDLNAFKPVATAWIPPVPFDIAAAWEGARPDRPAERVRVLAAVWGGRPVAFDTTDSPTSSAPTVAVRWTGPASDLAFVAVTLAVLLGGCLLARWNMRQGRWDRSGALTVAGCVFVTGLLLGLLRADHVPIAQDEYLIFARIAGWFLYSAGFIFLMYVAFEPFVRQRWPRVLTSWTRLLSGRVRDPLVGRDILVGALAGVATTLLRESEFIASRWLGVPSPPALTSTLDGLGTWRQFASLGFFVPLEALSLALGWLLLLLLLRIVFRSDRLAIAAAIVVVLPIVTLPGEHLLLEVLLGVLLTALMITVLLRFGLFALVVQMTFANALTRLPITLNAAEWYTGRSMLVLLCLSGIIVYGFRASVAGRQLIGPRLVED
jgi:serine/threonine protein kinase